MPKKKFKGDSVGKVRVPRIEDSIRLKHSRLSKNSGSAFGDSQGSSLPALPSDVKIILFNLSLLRNRDLI